jgi:hypothetical protein
MWRVFWKLKRRRSHAVAHVSVPVPMSESHAFLVEGLAFRRTMAGTADALLFFFPALALVRSIPPDLLPVTAGFVSATTRAGVNTWLNYVQFGLCAMLVWAAYALAYRRGAGAVEWSIEYCGRRWHRSALSRRVVWTLSLVVAAIYLFNVGRSAITGPLLDGFHEGEYLGFVPALASGAPVLASTFTVHGPGVDLLPGYVASKIGLDDHGIVLVRLIYSGLRFLAVAAALGVTLTLASLLQPVAARYQKFASGMLAFMLLVTILQVASWPDELALHKTLNARDLGIMVEVGVVLGFALMQRRREGSLAAFAYAAVAGALLPLAVFYSYDRGLYGAAFILVASAAFAMCGRKWAVTWLTGLCAGAFAGTLLVCVGAGMAGIEAVVGQLAFWVKYGRVLWAYPGIATTGDSWAGVVLVGCFVAVAWVAARVIESARTLGGWRAAVRAQIALILPCAAAISCLRMAVERGDAEHVVWGATTAWILLCVLAAKCILQPWEVLPVGVAGDPAAAAPRSRGLATLVISAIVGWNLIAFNPYTAFARLHEGIHSARRMTDGQILSQAQLDAVAFVHAEARSSPCFYTLTNEASWYYLLRMTSCSRFYQVTNARPAAAQREVIAALRATRPELILFSNGGWSNSIDGISLFNANPLVVGDVLEHYVPDRLVEDNWFWRRSDEPLQYSSRRIGNLSDAPAEGTRDSDLPLHGVYLAEASVPLPRGLIVTDGDANVPVWAGQISAGEFAASKWTAVLPTAALSSGAHRVRVWAIPESGRVMPMLGEIEDLRIR